MIGRRLDFKEARCSITIIPWEIWPNDTISTGHYRVRNRPAGGKKIKFPRKIVFALLSFSDRVRNPLAWIRTHIFAIPSPLHCSYIKVLKDKTRKKFFQRYLDTFKADKDTWSCGAKCRAEIHFRKLAAREGSCFPIFLTTIETYYRCSLRCSCLRNKARIAHKYFTYHPSRCTSV